MKSMWTDMATVLPEKKHGRAQVGHVTITKEKADLDNLRSLMGGDGLGIVNPGKFAVLYVDGHVMMSDTRMERLTNIDLIVEARGHVLVAGLGLGMVVLPLLAKREVKKLTVIEKLSDVIKLVERPIRKKLNARQNKRLEIIEADIFEWKPPDGQKFETIYFDIWPVRTIANLPEMGRLHRRFARCKSSKEAWMNSWLRDFLKAEKRAPRRGGLWI